MASEDSTQKSPYNTIDEEKGVLDSMHSVDLSDNCSSDKKSPQNIKKKLLANKISLRSKLKSFNVPAVLLVVFTIPASFVYGVSSLTIDLLFFPQNGCIFPKSNDALDERIYIAYILQNVAVFLLFPIAGWLSDTKLGRYRTIYYSLWFMWLGAGVIAGSFIVRHSVDPCDEGFGFIMGKYVLPLVGLIIISIGAALYFPNILALIMEHLMELSSQTVRSYVYWFVWALYVGFFFSDWINAQLYFEFTLRGLDKWFIYPILCSFAFFSICLIICFFYEKKFLTVDFKKNPYGIVYGVICFAIKHKYPINRSSLTFSEDELPGRLDLGKDKYGGPFKHEEVEDVKTLFRIIVFFLSFLPFFVAYSGPLNQLVPFIRHLNSHEKPPDVWFLYLSETMITITAIPILELIILPLFPKLEYFLQKPLRWMFASMIGLTLCNIFLLIIDVIAHTTSKENSQHECFINGYTANTDGNIDFNYKWIAIPTLLWGVCNLFIATSVFTFICSQAPYTLNGMLLGLFMFLQGAFKSIGDFLALGFMNGTAFIGSCGIWYWLTLAVLTIVGCLVFLVFAKHYKSRARWEVYRYREVIEDIYERRLKANCRFSFSNATEVLTVQQVDD